MATALHSRYLLTTDLKTSTHTPRSSSRRSRKRRSLTWE